MQVALVGDLKWSYLSFYEAYRPLWPLNLQCKGSFGAIKSIIFWVFQTITPWNCHFVSTRAIYLYSGLPGFPVRSPAWLPPYCNTLIVLFVEGELSSNCVRSNFVFIFARRGHLSPLQGWSTFNGKMLYYLFKDVNMTQFNEAPSANCTVSTVITSFQRWLDYNFENGMVVNKTEPNLLSFLGMFVEEQPYWQT